MVNPNKPIVNHKKGGISMRSHGTAMANSAKSMVKTYQKTMVNFGIYHGFIMIGRGLIC